MKRRFEKRGIGGTSRHQVSRHETTATVTAEGMKKGNIEHDMFMNVGLGKDVKPGDRTEGMNKSRERWDGSGPRSKDGIPYILQTDISEQDLRGNECFPRVALTVDTAAAHLWESKFSSRFQEPT